MSHESRGDGLRVIKHESGNAVVVGVQLLWLAVVFHSLIILGFRVYTSRYTGVENFRAIHLIFANYYYHNSFFKQVGYEFIKVAFGKLYHQRSVVNHTYAD